MTKIYDVEIAVMNNSFGKQGKTIGNIRELWHGTRIGNVLSILKSGFVIPPSNAPHVTGRLYGNGAYFSDSSTKSLNYSYGYWSGTRNNHCFMFLCDVAMGKTYTPSGSYGLFPQAGYDSTFAKGGSSGVINNEMIVYKTHQINPKYLLEFEG
jgi:poly [ADP-ribose] polymerase